MLNKLRSQISSALSPMARAIASSGISPNQLTVLGFIASLASACAFFSSLQLWGGAILLLSGFFDIIDGAVARASGKVTKWGGVLDSTLDRYSDLVILGAILISGLCDPITGVMAMIGSVMVSYVRAKGDLEGVKMTSVGIMERAERMVILAIAAIVGYTWVAVLILAVLTHVTVAQRLYHVKKSLSQTDPRALPAPS